MILMEETRSAHRILVGTSQGRKPLENPRLRWKDNFKISFKDIRLCKYELDWRG
jgi:hypothetical protein